MESFDLTYPSMYKIIEKRYMNDPEFDDSDAVYILTEHLYREEFLRFFGMTQFEEDEINKNVMMLFDQVVNMEAIQDILKEMDETMDDELKFKLLFSYHSLFLFIPYIQCVLKEVEIPDHVKDELLGHVKARD